MKLIRVIFSLAVLATILAPARVVAADCVSANLEFDVQPHTVETTADHRLGTPLQFRTRFAWAPGTSDECFRTPVNFQFDDDYNGSSYRVRTNGPFTGREFRVDFNESNYRTGLGNHRFYVAALVAERQITRSSAIQVTAVGPGEAAPERAAPSYVEPEPYHFQVPIGGLTETSSIGTYIGSIFRYSLSIAAILATVMIIIGGFQWLLAAGESGKITQARERITNAVLGLVLLLVTVVILNTINPELLKLRELNLPKAQRAVLVTNWCEDQDLNAVDLAPSVGACGQTAEVSARPGSTVTATSCTFRTCGAAEDGLPTTCVGLRGQYSCNDCRTVTDDTLEQFGLTENDAGCASFAPGQVLTRDGAITYDCVFSEDARLDITDDTCALVAIKCGSGGVEACDDYDDLELQSQSSLEVDLDEEVASAVPPGFGANTFFDDVAIEHLKKYCVGDPCNVGPCRLRETGAGARLASNIPILSDSFYQDWADCEPAR